MESLAAPVPEAVGALKAALASMREELDAARADAAVAVAEASAAKAERADDQALIVHLKLQVAELKRERFGRSSERTSRLLDQLELQLEVLEASATGDEVTGPINLGNPGEFTIRALAEMVVAQTGSASKITYQPLPSDDPKQRQPDISKARALLDDWQPTIALEQGLTRTIAYFDGLLKGGAA